MLYVFKKKREMECKLYFFIKKKMLWCVIEIDKDNVMINIYIVYVILYWLVIKYEYDCG